MLDFSGIDKNKIDRRNIRIDVGLGIDAPHTAHWLMTEKDTFIIAVEPSPDNLLSLSDGRDAPEQPFSYLKTKNNSIMQSGKEIKKYNPEDLFLVQGAIDDVGLNPRKQTFYCTDDINTGCSSLLKPTDKLPAKLKKEIEIDTYSLEYILDNLGLQDLGLIQFVKTDTQGKDFEVIKSLGKYLEKVVLLKCEWSVGDHYENTSNPSDFFHFMIANDFKSPAINDTDVYFVNMRYALKLPSIDFNMPEID